MDKALGSNSPILRKDNIYRPRASIVILISAEVFSRRQTYLQAGFQFASPRPLPHPPVAAWSWMDPAVRRCCSKAAPVC